MDLIQRMAREWFPSAVKRYLSEKGRRLIDEDGVSWPGADGLYRAVTETYWGEFVQATGMGEDGAESIFHAVYEATDPRVYEEAETTLRQRWRDTDWNPDYGVRQRDFLRR